MVLWLILRQTKGVKMKRQNKDEREVDLGLSSASTNTSFEQESSAETDVEKDHNEVHSEHQLQKEEVLLTDLRGYPTEKLGREKEKGKVGIKGFCHIGTKIRRCLEM